MPISAKPYRQKTFATVKGKKMAYIEADTGNAIVFQHGNPTSSYLWRNIMPHCEGLGRLIACDLIGMGDSDKLENSGADRYTYAEHCDYLFALWDQIGLGAEPADFGHGGRAGMPAATMTSFKRRQAVGRLKC